MPTDAETPSGGEPGQVPGQADPTQGADGARVAELQAALAEKEAALAEQRRIQGGLDKQITEYRTELETAQAERDQLLVKLNELSGERQTITQEFEQLQQRAVRQEAELGDLKGKAGNLEADAQRARMVALRHPHLAPLLEVDGLPPWSDPESYEQTLNTLTERMDAASDMLRQRQRSGAVPPAAPAAGERPKAGDLMAQMRAEAAKPDPDWAKYQELNAKWRELHGT